MRVAASMPPKKHWLGHDQTFSIERSEVVHWLIAQPECQQLLFNIMRNAAVIQFDLATKKWVGVDWKAPM